MKPASKILWLAATLSSISPALVLAQTPYPNKPIRIITEFVAGSGGDALLRIISDGLGPLIGQPVIIENRAGAGGVVAAEAVAHRYTKDADVQRIDVLLIAPGHWPRHMANALMF